MPISPDGTVTASQLWKRFKADRRRPLLRDEIERLLTREHGEAERRWRWALRDINFDIAPGESVGLFGTNGSGKSTLLKLLTRIMYPTNGSVEVRGRVGALIEIRAGIHPELTGRENIYMYGTILGLGRSTVAKRFDEIVAFAELEEALDRPVKFYSSGMAMRIGFAVAAYLEPDILLVDEVMAVGDATFQQKCLNRMGAVIADGTTVVFVSHDLPTIEAVCSRGIWLQDGEIRTDGPVRDALGRYRQQLEQAAVTHEEDAGPVRIDAVTVAGRDDSPRSHAPLRIRADVMSTSPAHVSIAFGITEGPATPTLLVQNALQVPAGCSVVECELASIPLPRGRYYVWTAILDDEGREVSVWQPRAEFHVAGPELDVAPPGVLRLAPVHVASAWRVD